MAKQIQQITTSQPGWYAQFHIDEDVNPPFCAWLRIVVWAFIRDGEVETVEGMSGLRDQPSSLKFVEDDPTFIGYVYLHDETKQRFTQQHTGTFEDTTPY